MAALTIRSMNPVNREKLNILRRSLRQGPVFITTHDNPDPDALASGKAMRQLITGTWGIPTSLYYNGLVGRAENRAMLGLLTPEWRLFDNTRDLSMDFSAAVFVDCQPGTRTSLPLEPDFPLIVIDHHSSPEGQTRQLAYADIRPQVGSTVTMAFQYLEAAHVNIDPILATAMFYGLRADTNGLSKGATADDGIAYVKLLERLDHQALLRIESAGLAREYYWAFAQGIQNARVYGKTINAHLGEMHRPDLAAELADLLFRYESVHAALCSGVYDHVLHFSVRTGLLDQDAGLLVSKVIFPPGSAGGHGLMAGGQLPLKGKNVGELVSTLERRFLESVGETGIAESLLSG